MLVEKMIEQAVGELHTLTELKRFVIICIRPCPNPVKWRQYLHTIFCYYSFNRARVAVSKPRKKYSPVVIFTDIFTQFFPFLLYVHSQYPSPFMINIPTVCLYNSSVYTLY